MPESKLDIQEFLTNKENIPYIMIGGLVGVGFAAAIVVALLSLAIWQ